VTVETPEPPASPRAPIACARCGATIEGEQSWCLECGLAARTRLAPLPNWRAPLIAAALVGLAAIVALVIAFLTITGDNAPLPTTAAPSTTPPADTTSTATVPTVATTTAAPPATTVAPTPTTTTPPVTTTTPAVTTTTTPATTTATTP
jgi:hypothetical protein